MVYNNKNISTLYSKRKTNYTAQSYMIVLFGVILLCRTDKGVPHCVEEFSKTTLANLASDIFSANVANERFIYICPDLSVF